MSYSNYSALGVYPFAAVGALAAPSSGSFLQLKLEVADAASGAAAGFTVPMAFRLINNTYDPPGATNDSSQAAIIHVKLQGKDDLADSSWTDLLTTTPAGAASSTGLDIPSSGSVWGTFNAWRYLRLLAFASTTGTYASPTGRATGGCGILSLWSQRTISLVTL